MPRTTGAPSCSLSLLAAPLAAQTAVDIPYERFVLPERPHRDRARGPQGADRRGERLVPRRLEERAAGPDRLRAPVRAPDVQRQRALRQGVPGAARAGRRDRSQRHDQRGPHQLLRRTCRPRRSTWRSGSSPTAWATCVGAISQAKLDEQRGVVQNEKRAGRERALRQGRGISSRPSSIPANHPYSWTVIGSMDDLDAATLDDVKDWFQTYYGPANAVLVLAGDIDAEDREGEGRAILRRHSRRVRRWRGRSEWIAKRTGQPARRDAGPRAAEPGSTRCGTCPQWGSADARLPRPGGVGAQHRQVVAALQAAGLRRADRHRRGRVASSCARSPGCSSSRPACVRASTSPRSSGRSTRSWRVSSPAGPTPAELARAKTLVARRIHPGRRADRRLRRQVGRAGQGRRSSPGGPISTRCSSRAIGRGHRRTGAGRRRALALATATTRSRCIRSPSTPPRRPGVDRSKLPEPGAPPRAEFPDARARHAVERSQDRPRRAAHRSRRCGSTCSSTPGFASDQFALPGTASLAMSMLDEGTDDPDRAPDQRPAGGSRRHARRVVAARCLDRLARGAPRRARSRRSSSTRT